MSVSERLENPLLCKELKAKGKKCHNYLSEKRLICRSRIKSWKDKYDRYENLIII